MLEVLQIKLPVIFLASGYRRCKHIFASYKNPGFLRGNWGAQIVCTVTWYTTEEVYDLELQCS